MNALGIAGVTGVSLLLVSAFIDRVNRFQARRGFKNFLKTKGKWDPCALENPKNGSVVGNTDYLEVSGNKGDSFKLLWNEIEEVHAFKRDIFSMDLICLVFKKSGAEQFYEIHEEFAGYHDLLEILPNRLPKFTSDWFPLVAFPAFKTNHQIIWKRSTEKARQAIGPAFSS